MQKYFFNEAFKLGDHVAIMKDGIIEQIGTPEDVDNERRLLGIIVRVSVLSSLV